MKKVLLSLLAVAALVLSCQNYDDEFASLNSKIASLESQITSLAELRTAVTGVQSSVTALQSAVSAAAAAADAATDAAKAASDAAVAAGEESAAAAAAAATAAATNATAVSALATSISAIAADLVDLQTAIDGATTEADLDALKAELNTTLAALQSLIETNASSITSLITANTELKDALEELGVDVTSILAANATFEGNLTITNAAELAYAKSLGIKLATIKGDVYVMVDEFDHTGGGDGTGLTAAEVNSVTSIIKYVVGNVKLVSDKAIDVSALQSVTGDYSVIGHDANDDALLSVGDDVHFNYDGAYKSNIQTADNIYLVAKPIVVVATGVTPRNGTTEIDFLALTKASGVQTVSEALSTAHTSGGSLAFLPSADTKTIVIEGNNSTTAALDTNATTSVKIGQAPVIAVTGKNKLTTIELHYAADFDPTTNKTGSAVLASLSISGANVSTATIMAATITGNVLIDVVSSSATSAKGTIKLPKAVAVGSYTSDALENEISTIKKITGATGLVLTNDTAVSMPVLATSAGPIQLDVATTFSASVLSRVGSATATVNGSDITANLVTGVVSFSALTKAGDIEMQKATSITAKLAKVNGVDIAALTSTVPTTIELGSVSSYATPGTAGVIADPTTVSVLKLHKQDAAITLNSFTNATNIEYIGALTSANAAHGVTIGTGNTKLKTLTLGGVLSTVSVATASTAPRPTATGTTTEAAVTTSALTSVSTSGKIQSLTVDNNYNLKTLNALHTDSNVASAAASVIIVRDNYNLTSIKTGITLFGNINIQRNIKLTTLDLSSVVKLPVDYTKADAVTLTVLDNFIDKDTDANYTTYTGANQAAAGTTTIATYIGMTGTYTAGSSASNEVFGQSQLATTKTFVQFLQDKFLAANAPESDSTGIDIDMNYPWHDGATPGTVTEEVFNVDGNATSLSGGVSIWTELLRLQ